MGQSTVDLALKNLHRQKWQRSHELLTKALAKDSLNVTAKYVLAQYFFSERNPAFQLDSAYRHALAAQHDFQKTTLKQRDKLKKFPVDSILLLALRKQIDSVAFNRTRLNQSEQAWTDFIEHFPFSHSLPRAMALRDSLAYEAAVRENTYQSFENFLQRYPGAIEVPRARDRYEQLLFEDKTRDQTLASFVAFLSEYPSSPYRATAEQTVFEYQTASGQFDAFIEYIQSNPQSQFVSKAKNILFHLIPPSERAQTWPADFSNDSLSVIVQLEEDYLVPFLTKKKFGFMNHDGTEIISPQADSLGAIYQCGNVNDDVLILPDKVIARDGACIWNGNALNIEDIGSGFLVVEAANCKFVLHKTGFKVGPDCIDEARILNGKFVAIEKDEQWSVWTFTGRSLLQDVQSVFNVKNVIAFKKDDKVRLVASSSLASLPLPPDYGGNHEYEEVRSWNNDLVFVRNGTHTGLLDQSLREFVPSGDQIISPVFFGVVSADSSGYRIHSYAGKTSHAFEEVIARDPWIAVKDSLWRFLDPKTLEPSTSILFDTVFFQGPFAIAEKLDSSLIFLTPDRYLKSVRPSVVEFVPGKDSLAFLVIEHSGKKTIYNQKGKKILTSTFDKIQYGGQNLFIVHKKEKKGLMTINGNFLLPIEYDAIAPVENGIFSLLKATKFGLFDSKKKKQISPAFSKNLGLYTNNLLTAYKDGFYGLIGWNNKPVSKFEFNEIQFWNDSTALVKKNFQWMLYEIKTRKVLLGEIKDIALIRNTPSEKLAIVHQGVNYGVIHNQRGIILPFSFTDVVNVGSAETPLYFTEKKVEEAPVFIVTYYNDRANAVRTEVYDPDDYDKIYCHPE